jgi:hypothetical protein
MTAKAHGDGYGYGFGYDDGGLALDLGFLTWVLGAIIIQIRRILRLFHVSRR